MLIIEGALVFVAKDLVGLSYGLELCFGFVSLFLGNFVGMMLKRKLDGGGRRGVRAECQG